MVDLPDDPKIATPRRLEILNGADRRRQWTDSEKANIVAETFAPGAVVTHIARRHDVRAQQIHGWRKDAREGRLVLPADAAMAFAPIVVSAAAPPSARSRSRHPPSRAMTPIMEIDADHILVRVFGGAEIALVAAILGVLSGRT